jgi:hypothetical protein
MSLSSIVLTSFVGAYNLDRVSHDNGPIKALLERISDNGVWHYVVAADAPMDVL